MGGQHRSGSSGQHRLAPSPELLRQWRVVRWLLAAVVGSLAFGSWWFVAAADTPAKPAAKSGGMAGNWPAGSTPAPPVTAAATLAEPSPTSQPLGSLTLTASGPGKLVAGSDPRDLPRPLLISDEHNNRLLIIDRDGRTMWEFPRKGDLAAGQTFKSPDDAYFTPDGNQIISTQGDDNVISVIDIATRKIVYSYGKSGVTGSGPNRLFGPDDAMMLPNGDIVASDISNCRIIMIRKGGHTVTRQIGRTGICQHTPPQTLGSPSGAFPMMNGNYLVSEIKGGWVSETNLSGRVLWSTKVPTVAYITDPNEISKDRYLTVDYSNPGQVVTFNRAGKVLWRYAPTGEMALKKPSQAMPLPNGNYMVADRGNHRLIIVAPGNKAVLWQYGHTGVAGKAPGFLNYPTGMDFLPPDSLLVKHGASMGKIPR
jgi:DNA-binding beta-propeller fold protein YncE